MVEYRGLDYRWEQFSFVTIFVTQDDYETVCQWYGEHFPSIDFPRHAEEGHFEAYAPNELAARTSLLLADLRIPQPLKNLEAYIGSKFLGLLAPKRRAQRIGLYFVHEPSEELQKTEAFERRTSANREEQPPQDSNLERRNQNP